MDLSLLFQAGAGDVHDFVSYDSQRGDLKVDVDGTGSGGIATIATFEDLPPNLTIISNSDVFVL
ncbi:hypothetical protein [Mesorhizobium sp. dw_380]|uniref:hypothetical protein n=1 Tax=Mesorhizobium sp. dw_380 TaxID=2812001 RepID=UPI003325E616